MAAGLELFRERGYDATTIGDIAEAADIAPRTFFGYFAAKEDVVFHDFDRHVGDFASRLQDRPAEETAFEALRAWVAHQAETQGLDTPEDDLRRSLIDASPALAARHRTNLARFEAIVAQAVARDLDLPPGHLRPRLVAAAAVAALEALGRDDRAADSRTVDACDALAVLDEALTFLAGGLAALRERSPV